MLITNNCASFDLCGMENLVRHQNVSKYYENNCLRLFFAFYVSFNSCNCQKQLYLSWNLLFLSKIRPKTTFKVFQYQILTSVKKSEKHLANKPNFSTFLQLSYLNFKLKLCEWF